MYGAHALCDVTASVCEAYMFELLATCTVTRRCTTMENALGRQWWSLDDRGPS